MYRASLIARRPGSGADDGSTSGTMTDMTSSFSMSREWRAHPRRQKRGRQELEGGKLSGDEQRETDALEEPRSRRRVRAIRFIVERLVHALLRRLRQTFQQVIRRHMAASRPVATRAFILGRQHDFPVPVVVLELVRFHLQGVVRMRMCDLFFR